MQNSKRRRGISLSHHLHNTSLCQTQLDRSVYVEPQSTRMLYTRYPMQQTPSRHASAPKTKVQFNYPVNFLPNSNCNPHSQDLSATPRQETIDPTLKYHMLGQQKTFNRPGPRHYFAQSFVKTESRQINSVQQQNRITPIQQAVDTTYKREIFTPQDNSLESTSIANIHFPFENLETKPREIGLENITQKYVSFQHCKQSIGKRLFGVGPIKRKDNPLQQSDRCNRWLQEASQTGFSKTSIDESIKEVPKITSSNRKLEIQREVVTYVAESKVPKENVAPPSPINSSLPPKKQAKRTRDPQKLQEMEKRLMEIIKICDENLC